ncbi:RHS repeat-associated core domain-containing protein [Flavobacterium piscinae]|uniref:RHS repeat-associated core domain-containing protein n=1 Tax=Flavobacterium piscinae TaxID=2506424 RepID=A0A4Q1KFQ0_9FLAO|nr:RHS repeat-associated core domain-containing protein [Flavobacterium piscinae]RXR27622.1 RHS repeat-associated core domain-containing protein [Flavobacterium piscinae]
MSTFGMLIPNRFDSLEDYRYGFNGKEKDDEVKGEGLQIDYGFRIYDPRIGRFLSMDPLFAGYPYYTPYQFAGNRPIWAIDLDGLEELTVTKKSVVMIYEWGVKVNGEIWDNSKRKLVKSGEEILQQGDVNSKTIVTETIYTLTRTGGYNSTERTYTIEPSPPSPDPNDNSKEINIEPPTSDSRPVFNKLSSEDIVKKTTDENIRKVEPKNISTPKVTDKSKNPINPIKPGDNKNINFTGLIYPSVVNSGFHFIDPGTGSFPAKNVLKNLVNDLNNSKQVSQITITGTAFHGDATTSNNVKAAFYTGLLKIETHLRELGLRKNVKIKVDYDNVKAKKSKSENGTIVNFKFE